MLTHGAKHQRGLSVPPIRVGVGGHRPRRTSQLALSRPAKHARGYNLSKQPNPSPIHRDQTPSCPLPLGEGRYGLAAPRRVASLNIMRAARNSC